MVSSEALVLIIEMVDEWVPIVQQWKMDTGRPNVEKLPDDQARI